MQGFNPNRLRYDRSHNTGAAAHKKLIRPSQPNKAFDPTNISFCEKPKKYEMMESLDETICKLRDLLIQERIKHKISYKGVGSGKNIHILRKSFITNFSFQSPAADASHLANHKPSQPKDEEVHNQRLNC